MNFIQTEFGCRFLKVNRKKSGVKTMTKLISLRSILLVPIILLAALSASAQTANLTGSITDATSAAIAGAQVTVADPSKGTQRVVTANEEGFYTVAQLLPGTYTVIVKNASFKSIIQSNVTLAVGQTLQINFKLEVGDVSANVTVNDEPPTLALETSSLGTVISNRDIQDTPLNGRSPFRLVQITPGILSSVSADGQFRDLPVNTTFETNFSINGGRSQSNEVLIDGVPSTSGFFNQATTIPTVESAKEFKVESNSAAAEFGRFGGGVVNVATKSGGNRFRGTLYEFHRNDLFDANEYFNKKAGSNIPPFKMNQFGYALSGPVYLPRFGDGGPGLYNGKNKTFFFTDYQGTRWSKGDVFISRVPTAAQRSGDFSALLGAVIPGVTNPDGSAARIGQIYDPLTTNAAGNRNPFPGNIIPANRFNPIAVAMLKYFPLPNTTTTGTVNNFVSNAKRIIGANQFSGRIDHNISDRWRTFGRYSFTNTDLQQPDYFGNVASSGQGSVGTTNFKYHTFVLDNSISLDPNTLLDLKVGYARWYQVRQTRSFGFDETTLGFSPAVVSSFQAKVFPIVNITGYAALGGQSIFRNGNDTFSFLPSLTKVFGRHNLKTGGDFRLRRIGFFNVQGAGAIYNFDRAFTRGTAFNTARTDVGDAIASLLLGLPAGGNAPIQAAASLQNYYFAGYVQDTFKFSKKMILNIGLRYEVELPYTERYNRLISFDPNAVNPVAAQAQATYTTLYNANPAAYVLTPAQFQIKGAIKFADSKNRTVYNWDKNNFSPRVGFAFALNDKTVIRGGFGISYQALETTNNGVGTIPNTGFSSTTNILQSSLNGGRTPNPAFNLANPFPTGLIQPTGTSLGTSTGLGQSFDVWTGKVETPYTIQWSLNVQRELPFQMVGDIAYAGSRGVHLTRPNSPNALNPSYFSYGTLLTNQVNNPLSGLVTGTIGAATVAQSQLVLPFPEYGAINVINYTSGNSTYHSLQAKLNKRLSNGVNFLISYTFSKTISDTTIQLAPLGDFTNFSAVQNWYNFKAERSLSEFDTPHALAIVGGYLLPFGQGRTFHSKAKGVTQTLLGGFQLNFTGRYTSGVPLQFVGAAPQIGGNRPNFTGAPVNLPGGRTLDQQVLAWFNTDAFARNLNFQLGNVPRTLGSVRGPSFRTLDMSLIKNIKVSEHQNLQFRLEYFNVFNTVNLGLL